ncbi:MAG TPA: bifunctional ADP-heptose synthase [Chitinophagales bacterium]|nr:bifunctional ADP-heptose synthase [Chitinophagales bacterium]
MATSKPDIKKLFRQFNDMRVMIVGDVMLDKYIYGQVDRISPEAPVPIVDVRSATARPGGAANVAVNIAALGATPYLFSVTGKDHDADLLCELMEEQHIDPQYLLHAADRITTSKMRVVAKQHQMLRIDHEMQDELQEETAITFLQNVVGFIKKKKPHVVILEDYDKGVLSASLITEIISKCHTLHIPVVVDPKKKHFFHYKGCTLFKPNLRELRDSLDGNPSTATISDMKLAVAALQTLMPHHISMVTLGEYGVFIQEGKKSRIIPAHHRNIADVSGAGDTVISVAALCLAAGADIFTTAAISNLAGGLVCEHAGVVPVDKQQLLKEALAN